MGSMGNSPPPTTEQQKYLDILANHCANRVTESGKSHYWLNLFISYFRNLVRVAEKCKLDNLTIKVRFYLTPNHDDSWWLITVKEKRHVVLKATCKGMVMENVTAIVYHPGEWENKIIDRKRKRR